MLRMQPSRAPERPLHLRSFEAKQGSRWPGPIARTADAVEDGLPAGLSMHQGA
jgi:hypothetical protein